MAKALKKVPAKAGATVKKLAVKAKPPAIKAGSTVTFKGYADGNRADPLFQPNDSVYIAQTEQRDGKTVLVAIAVADKAKFKANPEDDTIVADELSLAEVSVKAPAVAKAEKAPKEPEAKVEVKDVGKLPAVLQENRGDLLKTARGLYENIQQSYFYLGGLLSHIFYEGLFASKYGYKDDNKAKAFDEFCQAELGFGGRKARYLSDVYMRLSSLKGFKETKLKGIGWTKAAEIARAITNDNMDELLDKAEELSVVELKAEIQENYVVDGVTTSGRQATRGGASKRIDFKFRLFEDQAEGIKIILAEAQKQTKADDLNQVFEQIVNEWAAEHLGGTVVKRAERASKAKAKQAPEGADKAAPRKLQKAA